MAIGIASLCEFLRRGLFEIHRLSTAVVGHKAGHMQVIPVLKNPFSALPDECPAQDSCYGSRPGIMLR